MPEDYKLDPRTADVHYEWEDFGQGTVGRVYYWFDPEGRAKAVDDDEFRARHPEYDDRTWQRLFYEAFDRGQTAFETSVKARCSDPGMDRVLSLGRLFGPRPPRE
jgi:hypothetical protein